MTRFSKESLETLRSRIDLVEVLRPHIDLKRVGSAHKACCPFHDEKTPSFMIQRGDTHYHCFGCGAHGDAIAFLMTHVKLSFSDAVQQLAEQFQVPLEHVDDEFTGPKVDRKLHADVMQKAAEFFHFYLMETDEGKAGVSYLKSRGLSLDFLKKFGIGYAPGARGLFQKIMREAKVADQTLREVGLLNSAGREFFSERIVFPIRDRMGRVIGFSARKIREEVFGGKYINSPETPLFKKSRVLYGIYESRLRMVKEKKALIVEGQLDALRLIDAGFNFTVAPLGTAFGEGHVRELTTLGVTTVTLALDGDEAGDEAAIKMGDQLMKAGLEVKIVQMARGMDPDQLLQREGKESMERELGKAVDFLQFLVDLYGRRGELKTPAAKNSVAKRMIQMIEEWEAPMLIYESRKTLAKLLDVPEAILGVNASHAPQTYTQVRGKIDLTGVDADAVLEGDLLRWLLLLGEKRAPLIERNLKEEHFTHPLCRKIFTHYMGARPTDLLSVSMALEEQTRDFLDTLMEKKVNVDRADELLEQTIGRLLERSWMREREEIKVMIQSGRLSESEAMEAVKAFDTLKRSPPKVQLLDHA